MWGMLGYKDDKPKAYVHKGYLGDLSKEQDEVFQAFKKWILEESGYKINPWFNDTFYLKYCRARKFNLDAIKLMFTNYMKYREDNGIDNIIATFNADKKKALHPFYKKGYCGVDKIGRPIYIEHTGQMNVPEIYKICDDEYLW